jgi:nucleotide-binding universal stress UspA family protein
VERTPTRGARYRHQAREAGGSCAPAVRPRLDRSTVARLARDQAREAGIDLQVHVLPGHAAELIVRRADEGGFDLVVVGHKGHFLEDYLLGSTADRVAQHAVCPVMIVK